MESSAHMTEESGSGVLDAGSGGSDVGVRVSGSGDTGQEVGTQHSALSTQHLSSGLAILALLMLAFVGLLGRLIWIHSHDGPVLLSYAARQHRSTVPLIGRRGMITDCQGRILAGTHLRQSVFADPKIISDKRQAAQILARILNEPVAELETDLLAAGDRRFQVLAHGVPEASAQQIRDAQLEGIGLFDEPYRVYPLQKNAAALIGFVAPDGHGVSGIEHQFEAWLTGRSGYKTVIRDVRRRSFWLAETGYQPPRDGLNVVLTIDAAIQEQAERIIEETVRRFEAESAVAIVMRPGTGDILAMVNYPGFEPAEYRDFAPPLYRNRAITDPVEPGSIFKPFIAAAALSERITQLSEVFDCKSGLLVDGDRLLHDHHPYTLLSFQDIVVKSSNIGMALIGKRLGNERMHRYVRLFGFGEPTGIELSGEDAGLVVPLERWNSFTTTSIPMGHEIAVTPLQIARAFCVFANGGRLVRPRIVRAILEGEDNVVRDFADDDPAPRVIPETLAARVKNDLLAPVVERGTGVNAALTGYQVFGKTGTAQLAGSGGRGYIPNAYISSFIGGVPAYAPQIVVLVSITKPLKSKGYYGGTVAAPAAGDLMAFTVSYLKIPPELDLPMAAK